ncbi:GNAT family N-acetyltransferase [Streptomyces sp. NBC_00094]|uniref:GNAT family N-acetyltransferase n=1 Tax=Streptomyces sp. NBC_00094 TaxID=2903620 RepID=UPI00225B598D|nr:GNAT family N-acetyltransferase [Streptomyces sp. NBC_00094]MCX5390273.1 GNAT family N-acetyltransferase [Streptomyces sp. NBC_00094]
MIVPETQIRTAEAGDDTVLAELDRATWSPLHAVLPAPTEPYEPFFDTRHPPEDYLVAVVGGEVVGYVRLGLPTPLAATAHVRQIQGLVVAESVRGRGVARALLRAATDRARAEGARRITLRVLAHNAPARALYASEGFVIEGVLPGELLIAGEYVDDVLMGKSLLD